MLLQLALLLLVIAVAVTVDIVPLLIVSAFSTFLRGECSDCLCFSLTVDVVSAIACVHSIIVIVVVSCIPHIIVVVVVVVILCII